MRNYEDMPKKISGVVLLGIDELKTKKGINLSRAQIYRKIAKGTFPQQVHLSDRRIAFIEAEIDDWIADRIAERKAVADQIKKRMERVRRRRQAA
jgi:prophage regulatory protein